MDVVGQITSITAQVLRRLADGVDGPPAKAEPEPMIRIETMHVHCTREMTVDQVTAKLTKFGEARAKVMRTGWF